MFLEFIDFIRQGWSCFPADCDIFMNDVRDVEVQEVHVFISDRVWGTISEKVGSNAVILMTMQP